MIKKIITDIAFGITNWKLVQKDEREKRLKMKMEKERLKKEKEEKLKKSQNNNKIIKPKKELDNFIEIRLGDNYFYKMPGQIFII